MPRFFPTSAWFENRSDPCGLLESGCSVVPCINHVVHDLCDFPVSGLEPQIVSEDLKQFPMKRENVTPGKSGSPAATDAGRNSRRHYRRLHGARVCGAKVHGAKAVGPG